VQRNKERGQSYSITSWPRDMPHLTYNALCELVKT